jgi:heme-degrading monooxygenase HmoA
VITVEEVWSLKPGVHSEHAMQAIEDVMGAIAHSHPGWCGHAMFLRQLDEPERVIIIYPWSSIEDHEDLVAQEMPHLKGFYDSFCTAPRALRYYTEISHH